MFSVQGSVFRVQCSGFSVKLIVRDLQDLHDLHDLQDLSLPPVPCALRPEP